MPWIRSYGKSRCISFLGLACVLFLPIFLIGDECFILPCDTKLVFGDTTIVKKVNPSEDEVSISIYCKEKLKAKLEGVWFERIFPSPKFDYFLGVTNTGIPGTAFILFSKYGMLLREVKHDFLDFIPYCGQSLVCDRTWYNDKNPGVEFVFDEGGLSKVFINGCDGKRYNLFDRILFHRSADGKIEQLRWSEADKM